MPRPLVRRRRSVIALLVVLVAVGAFAVAAALGFRIPSANDAHISVTGSLSGATLTISGTTNLPPARSSTSGRNTGKSG